MNKENKRKIVIPFTLEQFKDTIERIKAEYNAGNLNLVGLFEIETLEYYCEKAKENEQAQKQENKIKYLEKQEKLLELYKELAMFLTTAVEDGEDTHAYTFANINNLKEQILELEK